MFKAYTFQFAMLNSMNKTRFLVIGILVMLVLAIFSAGCTQNSPSSATTNTGAPESTAGSANSADYTKGYELGLEAYTYGLPLLETYTTFETMTSVDVSNSVFGPVNQFNNERSLNNPGSTAVVATSPSSLSSIAWLDLSKEPQVLHVPEVTDHSFSLSLIDPYTITLEPLTKPRRATMSLPALASMICLSRQEPSGSMLTTPASGS